VKLRSFKNLTEINLDDDFVNLTVAHYLNAYSL